MSNHNAVEITGNIIVHHPERKQAEVIYTDWFNKEWETVRLVQEFYKAGIMTEADIRELLAA
jgi:hypothetical protein